MTHRVRRIRTGIAGILLGGLTPAVAAAQTGSVPLSPEAWTATDSIRSVSYLGPGAWTSMRIEVAGTKARLYVNGASQPCLIVHDLKHGDGPGRDEFTARAETRACPGAA